MPTSPTDSEMVAIASRGRTAARNLQAVSGAQKNACLRALSAALLEHADKIAAAAAADAAGARAQGAAGPVVAALRFDRTALDEKDRLAGMLRGLPDPVGRIESTWIRPNGLKIEKIRVPLGVVGVLVEYAPLTVVDAAFLCTKAGDALLLHAGPTARRTCECIVAAFADAGGPVEEVVFLLYAAGECG